jgi:hypothetical protein
MKLDSSILKMVKGPRGFFGLLPYFNNNIQKLEVFLKERTSLYEDFQKQRTCFLEVQVGLPTLHKWRFNAKVLDIDIDEAAGLTFFLDVETQLSPEFYDEFKYWLNSLIEEEEFNVQFLNPTTNPLNILFSDQPTLIHITTINGKIAFSKKTMPYFEMDKFFISKLEKYEIH